MALCSGCYLSFSRNGKDLRVLSTRCLTLAVRKCIKSKEDGDKNYRNTGSNTTYEAPEDQKKQILDSSLSFVHEYGWTKEALAAGAKASGLASMAHGLFPKGGIELVNYFYLTCNNDMGKQMEKYKENDETIGVQTKTTNLIRYGLLSRLQLIIPYISTWSQAMALMALPQNAPQSWANLFHLADEVWFQNGDASTDMNWYTKRLIVGAVYKSSEFHMLQDMSENFTDTEEFLDRRLTDAKVAGKAVRQVQQSGDVFMQGIGTAAVLAKNMLGMNNRYR